MDKEAIQQIQESANIPELIESFGDIVEKPAAIVPDSFHVEDLEGYMDSASHYRVNFRTPSINDFISYTKEHLRANSACFVDPDEMCAKTVIDLGSHDAPGHQKHNASLALKKTAALSALLAVDGQLQSQKKAAEFIEDWSPNFKIFTSAGDSLTPAQAAKALLDLTIDQARSLNTVVGDFEESMSVMEKVEARSKELLPGAMEFKCAPYMGLPERTFKLRVSMLTGSDVPKLVFRILRVEEQVEQMAEEFKHILLSGFEDTALDTFIGSI